MERKNNIESLNEYREERKEYLGKNTMLREELNPQNDNDFKAAKAIVREEMREELQRLIEFRLRAGQDLNVTLYHTSDKNAWDGHLQVGGQITLAPGMHNHYGAGVYFLESDSFKFYKERRHTSTGDQAKKPITFIIPALDVSGRQLFKSYNDLKQGRGRHSQRGLIHITITKVVEEVKRLLVEGVAVRESISQNQLRDIRKEFGIKKTRKT